MFFSSSFLTGFSIAIALALIGCQNVRTGEGSATTTSDRVVEQLKGVVVKPGEGRFVPAPLDAQNSPDYYVFYFSAHWCQPCQIFTPELISFYHANRDQNFEIIFLSGDYSEDKMLEYMNAVSMPWPAVSYASLHSRPDIARYAANYLPSLTIVQPSGKIVFHGSSGSAADALAELKKLLGISP